MKQSGARSAPGFLGYLVSRSNKAIGNHQACSSKKRCGLRENANRFAKTLQAGGLQSSQGALRKTENKTERLRGHESSIPRFIFRGEHVFLQQMISFSKIKKRRETNTCGKVAQRLVNVTISGGVFWARNAKTLIPPK